VRVPCSTPAAPPAKNLLAARLDTDQAHVCVVDERVKDPNRIAAAAHARDHRVRKTSGLLEDLPARFASDHRLEFADHQRIRMRAEG
jgi:hypothetical protein